MCIACLGPSSANCDVRIFENTQRSVKAKFYYASLFEAGSKLVADRFKAGRRPASNQLA